VVPLYQLAGGGGTDEDPNTLSCPADDVPSNDVVRAEHLDARGGVAKSAVAISGDADVVPLDEVVVRLVVGDDPVSGVTEITFLCAAVGPPMTVELGPPVGPDVCMSIAA